MKEKEELAYEPPALEEMKSKCLFQGATPVDSKDPELPEEEVEF